MSNITITISAENVAWYGAIVATVSMLINLFNFFDNKIKVKVEVRRGYRILNASPPYKSDEDYVTIAIANKGKRPITIGNVGYIAKKGYKSGLLTESIFRGNREITEGKSTEYLIEEKKIDFSIVKYFVAYDKVGRCFKGKLKE